VGGLALHKLSSKGVPFTIAVIEVARSRAKTKGNIRNVMAVIFKCAMRWGLLEIGVNPAALVRVKGISRAEGATHLKQR
jgi:hypothetical protein